jgi:uncharacterized protein YegJ (DUF2314 family)
MKKSGIRLAAVSLSLAALCAACSRSAFPAKLLRSDIAMAQLAVYYSGSVPARSLLARAQAIAAGYPELKASTDLESLYKELGAGESRSFFSIPGDIAEYAPPNEQSLAYFARGIPEADFPKVASLDKVVILDFAYGRDAILDGLRAAYGIADQLANESGGYVWDESTREIFSRDAWKSGRAADIAADIPRIARHITVHYYKDGELFRQISLGMEKFGLPNIVVNQMPAGSSDSVNALVNLSAQSLYEGAELSGGAIALDIETIRNEEHRLALEARLLPGALKKGVLKALKGKPEEGDPPGLLLELAGAAPPWKSRQTAMALALADLFGSEDGAINVIHDEELLAASQRAKAKLPALKKEFAAGLESGGYLMVKLPFTTSSGGNEWMWVEVTEWKGATIAGILSNEPEYVPGLEQGAKVSGNESDVFDYIRSYADGREEGNETSAIIQRSQSDE